MGDCADGVLEDRMSSPTGVMASVARRPSGEIIEELLEK
jgi:hypothetical protein